MKKRLFATLLVGMFLWKPGPLHAGASIMIDLNDDGKEDRIFWTRFAESEEQGTFYQLQVADSGGEVLWEGPKMADPDHPLVFGEWHFGISLPQIAADIDLDGKVELLAPEPQSDVSPTWFRVLEWRQGRFQLSRLAALLEAPAGSGQFSWDEGEAQTGRWISSFEKANRDGTYEVKTFTYDGGENVSVERYQAQAVENGFALTGKLTAADQGNQNLEAWLENQRWYQKLEASMPRGVSLLIMPEPGEEPGWESVTLRERHEPGSGYDPDVAPMVGMFRVSQGRETTEWFDPIDAAWKSLDLFLQDREINLLVE